MKQTFTTTDEVAIARSERASAVTSEDEAIQQLLNRLTINPDIRFGRPNTKRFTVAYVLYQLALGHNINELVAQMEGVEKDDILACLAYAACFLEKEDIS